MWPVCWAACWLTQRLNFGTSQKPLHNNRGILILITRLCWSSHNGKVTWAVSEGNILQRFPLAAATLTLFLLSLNKERTQFTMSPLHICPFCCKPPTTATEKEKKKSCGKTGRLQLAAPILCWSSDNFLLHKQCLGSLWKSAERHNNHSELNTQACYSLQKRWKLVSHAVARGACT